MNKMKILFIISKVFFIGIFLSSGINKIFNFSGTSQYMASVGIPMTNLFLAGAIILLLAGSFSILFNYRQQLGALLLIMFLIPATIIFHNNLADQMQMIMFMKNVSILGGLIVYAVAGKEISEKFK